VSKAEGRAGYILHGLMSRQANITAIVKLHTVSLHNNMKCMALVDGTIVQDEDASITGVGIHEWELMRWWVHEY